MGDEHGLCEEDDEIIVLPAQFSDDLISSSILDDDRSDAVS